MFMRGGEACGPESDGGRVVRCLRTAGVVELLRGADAVDGGETELPDVPEGGGFAGGFKVELVPADDPDVPPTPADPAARAKDLAPAETAPTPVAAMEPTAMAPPARNPVVPTRSPPESAGDPPRTAANNFGICQQSIMKMMEAPMISSADMAGLESATMFSASVIQPTDRFMPVPISK